MDPQEANWVYLVKLTLGHEKLDDSTGMDERDREKSFEEEYNSPMSNILCLTIKRQNAFPTIHKIFCPLSEIYA